MIINIDNPKTHEYLDWIDQSINDYEKNKKSDIDIKMYYDVVEYFNNIKNDTSTKIGSVNYKDYAKYTLDILSNKQVFNIRRIKLTNLNKSCSKSEIK